MIRSIKKIFSSIKNLSIRKLEDLDGIKKELDETLRTQNHKLIIFIDDIDRLNKTEIHQIFQLVKSLADFPKTIYILAFDKEIIINSLRNVQADDFKDSKNNSNENLGLKYLEKVVQVIFEVPKISQIEIDSILDEQLEILTKNERWNGEQWDYYYQTGIKYFFRNIRDINRFFNTLLFSFELLKDEVNLPDLFAITAIQVFIPKIYNGIKNNQDIFAGDLHDIIKSHGTKKSQRGSQFKDFVNKLIEDENIILKENLLILLKSIFPTLVHIYGDKNYPEVPDRFDKQRINKLDMFETYFKLNVPKWEVSQKNLVYIMKTAYNVKMFRSRLSELDKDKKINKFLKSLLDYNLDKVPSNNIKVVICVLMDASEKLSLTEFMGIDELYNALIHLAQSLNQNERFETIKNAIIISES